MRPSPRHRPSPPLVATFVGVLPGPRNGMTLFTEAVVDELGNEFDLRTFDVGAAYRRSGWRWRLGKGLRSLASALWLLTTPPRRPGEPVYLVANARGGLLYNLLQAGAARLRGYRVFLHHHVYAYIDRGDWRLPWLFAVCGDEAVHVVACRQMAEDLDCRYPGRRQYALLAPSVVAAKNADPGHDSAGGRAGEDRPFTIGHLSNLSVEKGLGEVFETLRMLRQRGVAVLCRIAGPCDDRATQRLLDAELRSHPQQIEWLGPVYGPAKAEFYESIDAMLFPTRYENESWGMVLDEALMASVPVIAYRAGCNESLLGGEQLECERPGMLVERSDSLPEVAAEVLEHWAHDPVAHAQARENAHRRGLELAGEGRRGLEQFIARLRGENEPVAVHAAQPSARSLTPVGEEAAP